MTADEVLQACAATIGKPLTSMQRRIGFPRETSIGGPLMRAMAAELGKHSMPWPWVVISLEQKDVLEQEIGRQICNSGDTLFGIILVAVFFEGEKIEDLTHDSNWLERDGGPIDLRGIQWQ